MTHLRRFSVPALAALLLVPAAARAQEFPPEWPPGAIVRTPKKPPVPCQAELSLKANRRGDEVTLSARAKNRTKAPLTLVLPDACAGGPVKWAGVRGEYDFYGRCNAGPCVQGPGQARITLKPGETRELAKVTMQLKGNSCNPAVPPGEHVVGFYLQFLEWPAEVCGNPNYKLVVAPPPAPPAPKEVIPPPPPPAKRPQSKCPNIPCGVYCEYGYARDENGCSTCGCLPNPLQMIVPPCQR